MIGQIIQDSRFAARMLIKYPGFTAITVLTLTIAIGANTAIFSIVNAVMLRPLPYEQPDRLVMLWEQNPSSGLDHANPSGPNLIDWRTQNHAFEDLAFWTSWNGSGGVNLVGEHGVEKVRTSHVSSTLFPLLRTTPVIGRGFLPEEDRYQGGRAAVIGYGLWQRRFAGKADVIDQTITVDTYGRREYTIVGVMPQGFGFPDQSELWLPAGWSGVRLDERRSAHWYQVLARLKPGFSVAQAENQLSAIQSAILRDNPQMLIGSSVEVVPLLDQALGRNLREALWILWAIVTCVLLIGCTNIANLMLAHTATRQKEIAVRLALGAGRARVICQLLTESLLLGLLGGGFGVLFAAWIMHVIVALGAGYVPRLQEVTIDVQALAFTLAVSIASALLFGLAPALQLSKSNCAAALNDGGRGLATGLDAGRMRGYLIVGQIALSVMLLIGAGLMINSFIRLSNLNRGFRPEHLLTAELDFSVSGFTTWVEPTSTRPQVTLRDVIQRLSVIPGIQSVAAASKLPRDVGGSVTQTITIDRRTSPLPNEFPTSDFQAVTPDYFLTMGIPLQHGRTFNEADDLRAPNVAVVNDAFIQRYLPDQNPIGQRLMLGTPSPSGAAGGPNIESQWKQIVGVVGNVRNLSLAAETMPIVYVPYCQWPMQSPTLLVRTSALPAAATEVIRIQVRAANANLPSPAIRTMDDILSPSIAQPRFHAALCAMFGITALLLSVAGTYGSVSYSVVRRTHEIGVRIALGAREADVLGLVLAQGARWVASGLALGLLFSVALTRVIGSQLFGITPTDPLTFAAASTLLASVALVASLIPAMRATRIDPTAAMRCE